MSLQSISLRRIVLAAAVWVVVAICATACNESSTDGSVGEGVGSAGTSGFGVAVTGGTSGAANNAASGIPTAGNLAGTSGTNTNIGGSAGNNQADGQGGVGGFVDASVGTDGAVVAGAGGITGAAGAGGAAGEAIAGAGGIAGAAEAGAGGAAGESNENPRLVHHDEDLGEGDGQDVITIGDSWMNIMTNGGGIEGGLDRVTGKRYRHFAVAGTTVLSEVIPRQYTTAKGMNPDIKTVVMTGGGNDVIMDMTIVGDCAAGGERCRQRLLDVMNRLAELWSEMSADGVRDVFIINYSEGAGSGVGDIDVSQEYRERISQIPPPIVLHYIETTEIVNNRLADGIHPTSQACTDIAQAVYDHMAEAGARR